MSLPVNKTVLRVTGVGLLMGDASVWAMAPRPPSGQTAGEIANTVVARWRERIAAQPLDTNLKGAFKHVPDGARPLGGLRAGLFMEAVAKLREHAVASDPQAKDEVATKAAFAVALMGITRPEEMTSLSSDCQAFSHWGMPVQTTANAMVRVAHRSRRLREAREETMLEEDIARVRGQVGGPCALDRGAAQHADANALAARVTRETDIRIGTTSGPQSSGGGANDAAPEGGPRQRIAALAGREDANAYLEGEAARLRKCSRKDTATVASALRAWHGFATQIAGYPAEASFPPRAGAHAEKFVALFRNGATAANYVAALKWAANWGRHSLTWFTPSVAMAVRGALNATRTNAACLKDDRFRLTTPVV